MTDRYDIVAIGGGTAGLVTAAGAAGLGARVALVASGQLGGECLWTGCVPSKAILAAARAAHDARRAARLGVHVGDVRVDMHEVLAHVLATQRRIAPHDSPERFRGLGVDVVPGHASMEAPDAVRVRDRVLRARHVVVATGSRPAEPPIAGLAEIGFLTNESLGRVDDWPTRLLVLGAGAVGLELGQAFARLGCEVTILEGATRMLPGEDDEMVELLAAALAREGVRVQLGAWIERVERGADGDVLAHVPGMLAPYRAEEILVAAGRRANTSRMGLEMAGVRVDVSGNVVVDDRLRTTASNVWACGDVVGGLRFTHVADYEARLVLRNALFPLTARRDYRAVPWVIFTDPELAHVGLTEAEARARHGDTVEVWRRPWGDLDRALTDGEEVGLLKLVTTRRGRILGGHVLGRGAGEVIHEIALAMRRGIGAAQLASTIHAYPTYSEAVRQAAEQWTKARFTGPLQSLVRWMVRR